MAVVSTRAHSLHASELMRRHMMTLAPEDSLSTAFQMIRLSRVRQLPVLRGESIVGEVSHLDTFLAYRSILLEGERLDPASVEEAIGQVSAQPVESVMRPADHCVPPEATVEQIVRCLKERGAGFVPVVVEMDDGSRRILGIVTETDLLLAALGPALS